MSAQSWIIDPAKYMGILLDPNGVCNGFAHTSRQLIREGRLDELDNLIKILQQVDSNKLTTDPTIHADNAYIFKQIAGDLKGTRFKLHFTKRDSHKDTIEIRDKKTGNKQLIDFVPPLENVKDKYALRKLFYSLPAFFNEIKIYQQANEHPELFERGKAPFWQEYQARGRLFISETAAEEYTEVARPVGRFYPDPCGNPRDLIDYVLNFINLIKQSQGQALIDAPLASGNHAIYISYVPESRELVLTNANPPPLLRLPLKDNLTLTASDTLLAAKFLQAAYFQNQKLGAPIDFVSRLSVPKKTEKKIEPWTNQWKDEFDKAQKGRISIHTANVTDPCNIPMLNLAALYGDTSRTNDLLQKQADPNITDGGETPLYVASMSGHLETVQCLLADKRADIEKGCIDATSKAIKTTPLHIAAYYGRMAIVEVLVAHNADIHKVDVETSKTSIYYAAERGFRDIAAYLLDKGASISQSCNGKSLLYAAAENGHEDMVKLLLERGADPTFIHMDNTALHIAAKNGHTQVVEVILKHTTVIIDKYGESSKTALEIAINHGYHKIAELLLAHGAKMVSEAAGKQLLLRASRKGYVKTVEWLLQHGVSHDYENKDPKAALEDAVRQETLADVYTLLTTITKRKANDPIDNKHHTLLGLAVKEQKIQSIDFLCDNTNADLHTRYDGKPMLFYATQAAISGLIKYALIQCLLRHKVPHAETLHQLFEQRDSASIDLLCSLGVSIDIPYQGESLLQKAVIKNDQAAIQYLLTKGANYKKLLKHAIRQKNSAVINSPALLLHAVKTNNQALIKWLLAHQASHAETLHLLLEQRDYTNITLLCSLGVPIDTAYEGKSLLQRAAVKNDQAAIKYLLSQGADYAKVLEQSMLQGETTIFYALVTVIAALPLKQQNSLIEFALKHQHQLTNHVTYLIDCQLDVNSPCEDDKSLLFKAVSARNEIAIKHLLKKGAWAHKTLRELIAANDQEGMRLFLRQLAPLDELYDGKPALYYAIECRNDVMVKMLIQYNASILKALECATINNNLSSTVHYLLPMLQSIDQPLDKNRRTLISIVAEQAPRRERSEVLIDLMERGANIRQMRVDGKPLLYHLILAFQITSEFISYYYMDDRSENTKIKIRSRCMNLLQKDPESIAESLWLLVNDGQLDFVALLLDSGVSPNFCYQAEQETPLHAAVRNGYQRMVELLLKKGADCHALCHGKKPVDMASAVNIKTLLEEHESKAVNSNSSADDQANVYTKPQSSTLFKRMQNTIEPIIKPKNIKQPLQTNNT